MIRLFVLLAGSVHAADFAGYISDAACGRNNARNDPHAKKCAQMCVKEGWDPVLVADGRADIVVIANKAKAAPFAGEYVKVSGDLAGDKLTIRTIRMAPAPAGKR